MFLPPALVPITLCTNAPFAGYLKPSVRAFHRCSHAPAAHPCLLLVEVTGKCLAGIFLAWGKVPCAEGRPRALVLPARQVSLRASTGHCKATALSSLIGLGKLFLPVYALFSLPKGLWCHTLGREWLSPSRTGAGWCSLFPGTCSPPPFPAASRSGCPPREKPICSSQGKAMPRASNAPRGSCRRASPWPWVKGEMEMLEPHGLTSWDHLLLADVAPFL